MMADLIEKLWEEIKPKPQFETFYIVTFDGHIAMTTRSLEETEKAKRFGNYFKTPSEALAARIRVAIALGGPK